MSDYARLTLASTKPEILASGSTFNQNTKSEIVEINNSVVHYRASRKEMYDEIIELSKEYPDEKFFITYWDDDFYVPNEYSGVFFDGTYHKTTIKPLYRFQIDVNIDVDRQLVDEFLEKIFNYLDEKKYKKDNSDPKIYYHVPNVEEVNDGLKASLKFTWETEDHRFIGENIHSRVIKISYENKDKENLEKLKSENSYLRQQLDSPIEYQDLPF